MFVYMRAASRDLGVVSVASWSLMFVQGQVHSQGQAIYN